MRDNKEVALKRVANVLDGMTKKEMLGWSPNCIGMLFQPERPTDNLFTVLVAVLVATVLILLTGK